MSKVLALRKTVEAWFEKSGHILYRHRLKALLCVLLVVGALASQIPNLVVDTSQESLLHPNDPIRMKYDEFRNQFGLDDMIVIAITPPEVFDADFLKTLKAFHEDLENEVPYVKDVTSLVNARHTYGEGDMLIVEDLLEEWPKTEAELTALQEKVLSNPVYLNNFISEDGRVTTVVIETEATVAEQSDDEILAGFDDEAVTGAETGTEARHYLTGEEITEVVEGLYGVIERYQSDEFPLALAGTSVQFDVLKRAMMNDMPKNLMLLGLIIMAVLFLFFRRISGFVIPLIVVAFSVVSTIGLMAVFKVPFTTPSQIIPTFLIAVGIGDAIHVLAIFYRRFQAGHSKEDAVAYALGHSGVAIVLTSLTTAAGLLSFATAEMAPVAHMGLFCAAGVMLALLYTIILIPALLALIPLRQKHATAKGSTASFMDRVLLGFAHFAANHPMKIVVVSLLLLLVSVPLIGRIEFAHDAVSWMPDTMQTKQDVQFIDQNLKGATTLEVVVDTKQENGLYEPEILHGLETISREIETIRRNPLSVGKVFSVNDLLKETNQALHSNDPAYYTIPQDRDTIAQELFLFENSGSDDMETLVDTQFSKARVTIKSSWVNATLYGGFIKDVERRFGEVFGDKVELTITGLVSIMARAVPASINSAVKSYIIAFVVIGIMMILLVGGGRIGFASMLPNILPIMVILGVMGAARIPMDMVSILIGSIAIGLVVDDTVHFIYNFRKYYHETGDARKAVEQALLGAGRAMLVTSVVLSSGFAVLLSATLLNMQRFGGLISATIIIALLADFVLAPALMMLVTRKDVAVADSTVVNVVN